MEKVQNIRLRLLSYVVIAYMLIAFAWWSILLYTKNQDAFLAKTELLYITMIAEGNVAVKKSRLAFYKTPAYLELKKNYTRQEKMIFGEAVVFILSLIAGVWLINRGYNKEIVANAQRRNFLLSITHELKSPIASIRLILETFLKRNLSTEQLQKFSASGLKETERLHTLVTDLLLSAKLETAYQLHLEPLHLSSFLSEMVQALQNKYPNATFNYQMTGDIPVIQADKTGMTSVALNLLENAIKYSPKGQEVITLNLYTQKDKVVFEVMDEGFGIPDKEKKYIFNKFYRVGNEDTRKTKGTGLGLYIVHEIVKAHKGHITVFDNKPQGTIFKITLNK